MCIVNIRKALVKERHHEECHDCAMKFANEYSLGVSDIGNTELICYILYFTYWPMEIDGNQGKSNI